MNISKKRVRLYRELGHKPEIGSEAAISHDTARAVWNASDAFFKEHELEFRIDHFGLDYQGIDKVMEKYVNEKGELDAERYINENFIRKKPHVIITKKPLKGHAGEWGFANPEHRVGIISLPGYMQQHSKLIDLLKNRIVPQVLYEMFLCLEKHYEDPEKSCLMAPIPLTGDELCEDCKGKI